MILRSSSATSLKPALLVQVDLGGAVADGNVVRLLHQARSRVL